MPPSAWSNSPKKTDPEDEGFQFDAVGAPHPVDQCHLQDQVFTPLMLSIWVFWVVMLSSRFIFSLTS